MSQKSSVPQAAKSVSKALMSDTSCKTNRLVRFVEDGDVKWW